MHSKIAGPEMNEVLIIEHNTNFRNALKTLLNSRSGTIALHEAVNETEAFDEIGKNIPQLIFSDVFLPQANGFQLIKKIRRACPGAKIIATSQENGPEYEKAAVECGADCCISKSSLGPVVIDELFESLFRSPLPSSRLMTQDP
jgi:DNA-binding NarL/FixJ family response regulator